MKKYLPYTLALLLAAAFIMLFVTGRNRKAKKLNERITLKRKDKIPYGSYVAFNSLPLMFPNASISINRDEPGYWDSLSFHEDKQLLIILTGNFDAYEGEMKKLAGFVEKGNDVLIIAQYLSAATDEFLECTTSSYDLSMISEEELEKKMKISLETPPFTGKVSFSYPGRMFSSYFSRIDSTITDIMGRDDRGRINFVRFRVGRGAIYVHTEPLAFSNYFILHKQNIAYYESIMSLFPADARQVVWDEYYMNKRPDYSRRAKKGWFRVLMGMQNENGDYPFRVAFLLLIFLLLLYVMMEMRRKQRYIPIVHRPRNDSLDFVRTIGRLYFDKGDHSNLARKMSAYFLEHVRSRYKLPTGTIDSEFIRNLAFKSDVPERNVSELAGFITMVESGAAISPQQLLRFHHQLEQFYKTS